MSELITLDTPDGLILSDLERKIVEGLSNKKSAADISIQYGIPRAAITNLLRKHGVKEFIQELVDARNQLMKMYLPDLLLDIIEDKVAMLHEEDEDGKTGRAADLTKKDVVDVAKQLNDLIKTTDSVSKEEAEDKFTKLYQQINIIQNGDK
jgi:hypothetical protein